jgi:serpin B
MLSVSPKFLLPIAVWATTAQAFTDAPATAIVPDDPLVEAAGQASVGFGLDVYSKVRVEQGNLVVAPLGLLQSLLPLAMGAGGDKWVETARALRIEGPLTEAGDGLAVLTQQLQEAAGGQAQLCFARALWVKEGTSVFPEYVEELHRHWRGELRMVDFSRPEHAAHWINRWVSGRSADRVQAIADSRYFGQETSLYIGSAVAMNVSWMDDYDSAGTSVVPFAVPPSPAPSAGAGAQVQDGGGFPRQAVPSTPIPPQPPAAVEVPMLRFSGQIRTIAVDGGRLIQLPFRNQALSLVVALPDKDMPLSHIEDQVTRSQFSQWNTSLRQAAPLALEVRMPRFRIEQMVSKLDDVLQSLGLREVYVRKEANLSRLGGDVEEMPVWLSTVAHLAQIRLEEPAVQSPVSQFLPGPGQAEYAVRIDRPFLFWVCAERTGALLFVGRINDPRQ